MPPAWLRPLQWPRKARGDGRAGLRRAAPRREVIAKFTIVQSQTLKARTAATHVGVRMSVRPSVRPAHPSDRHCSPVLLDNQTFGGRPNGRRGGAAAARCSAVAFIDIMYGKWISDDAGECSLTPTFALA